MWLCVGIAIFMVICMFVEKKYANMTIKIGVRRYDIKKTILFLVIVLMVFLAAMRNENVGDTGNYIRHFQDWRTASGPLALVGKTSDYGYTLLNWIIGQFTDSERVMLFVLALIYIPLIYVTFYKYSQNFSYSVFLYLALNGLVYQFSLMRQVMAIAVAFFAIRYVEEKKIVKFAVCLLAASLFHKTAIITVLMYIMGHDRKTGWAYLKKLGFTIGVILIALYGIPFLTSLYTKTDYLLTREIGKGTQLFIVYVVILIFASCYMASAEKVNFYNRIFYNIFMIGTILQILSFSLSILSRFVSYFVISVPVLVPNVIESIGKENGRRTAYMVSFALAMAFYIYSLSNMSSSGVFEYKFFWQ